MPRHADHAIAQNPAQYSTASREWLAADCLIEALVSDPQAAEGCLPLEEVDDLLVDMAAEELSRRNGPARVAAYRAVRAHVARVCLGTLADRHSDADVPQDPVMHAERAAVCLFYGRLHNAMDHVERCDGVDRSETPDFI